MCMSMVYKIVFLQKLVVIGFILEIMLILENIIRLYIYIRIIFLVWEDGYLGCYIVVLVGLIHFHRLVYHYYVLVWAGLINSH